METQMFDLEVEEMETETPRTHVQQFLSNVTTDPSNTLSSKRRQLSRSFVRTPIKVAKAKEKIVRLSTSLPSPGSLITPRSNLQHMLLGSDSAKTPLDRRVASARSSRSSTKSVMHDAPLEWGQKISLSPMFSGSPYRTDGESPSKIFKRPQNRRSFRLHDPPSHVDDGDLMSMDDVSDESNRVVDVDSGKKVNTRNENEIHENDMNEQSSFIHSSLKNVSEPSPPKDTIQILEKMNKTLQMEKAMKIYELKTMSTDEEDSLTDSASISLLRNRSLRNRTLNKTKTPTKNLNDSRRSIASSKQDASASSSKTIGFSHLRNKRSSMAREDMSLHQGNDDLVDDDDSISQFQSLSPSKKLIDLNTYKEISNSSTTPEKTQSLRTDPKTSRITRSSQVESPFKIQPSKSTSKIKTSASKRGFVIDKEIISSTTALVKEKASTSNPLMSSNNISQSTKGSSSKKLDGLVEKPLSNTENSMSSSYSAGSTIEMESSSRVKTLNKTQTSKNNSTLPKSSQPTTPIRVKPTRESSSRSKMNSSQSKRSNIKSTIDVYDYQLSDAEKSGQSSSSKKRKMNSLNNLLIESNPSSSTPFKRSRSIFNSTKMQTSISNHLASKDSLSHSKSVAIGDLSPIKPDGDHGIDMIVSDNEDPLNSFEDDTSKKSKLQRSHNSKNKERSDDQLLDDNEDYLNGFSPMRTPVIDMAKRPLPLTGNKSKTVQHRNETANVVKEKQPMAKKQNTGLPSKKKSSVPNTMLPRKTVKSMSELYCSMKMDKEALDELEKLSQAFMVNTLEAAESYSLHAGRKTINEADFILMMKKQRLIKTKEDLYDLIRKHLPMDLRCELIPCFPSHQ